MGKRRNIVLVLGMAMVLVGMNFATADVLPPTVTKEVSDGDIYFGTGVKETTVTIEVTGGGGTSSTITPMDVVFAIDSSGSMDGNDPGDLRLDAANYFVDQMDDSRDQAGVVSWNHVIDFAKGLWIDFDDTDGIKYWINQVGNYGGTNLNLGLNEAIDMLDANTRTDPSSEVIIFLTDGSGTYTPSGSPGSPADEADGKGYVIYSIGLNMVSGGVPEGRLIDMADATGGTYYSSPSASNLQAIYDAIYEEIVTSTIPHYVEVIEVLEDYIPLDEDSFNIDPDTITTNLDGTTTLYWDNIGQHTTDGDAALDADETVTLTFDVRSAIYGTNLDVEVDGEAIVKYYDVGDNYIGSVDIPQATIDAHEYVTDLIADGGEEYLDVGDVIIWNDLDYLYVKFVTTGDWEMTETHLHVADDADLIPHTKKGNPKVGKFDINEEHAPTQEVTYKIPWTWDPGTTLYIAAHAVVQIEIESFTECTEYRIETAWGEGEDFGGSSWAMYIEYEDP